MADLLTAVSTKKTKSPQPPIREIRSADFQDEEVHVNSGESVLKALKMQPSRNTFNSVLNYLNLPGCSLLLPEPLNANIAHQLVNDTLPNYWRIVRDLSQANLVAKVLRNPTGLGHIVTRLRSLIADNREKKADGQARNTLEHIENLLDLLDRILHDDQTSILILQDVIAYGKNPVQKKVIWREYLAQTASGRILSMAAEAEDVLRRNETSNVTSWIADGKAYASWLGRNMATLIKSDNKNEEYLNAVVELCSKGLGLGYTGQSIV